MTQKTALVTGASSGIGRATAHHLADAGYRVFAAGRDQQRTEQTQAHSPAIATWVGDLGTPENCASLVLDCITKFGQLDVLVNSAGIIGRADAQNTSDELWQQTLSVNLSNPFYMSRAAIPHLRQTRGVIINIASDWGLQGGTRAVAYCASKGGLVLMTRAMALDHAAEGIRVNAICPGDVDTPMLLGEGQERGLTNEQILKQSAIESPTGRVTSAAEVAVLVVFLASTAAAQITGAAIPIDGGNVA